MFNKLNRSFIFYNKLIKFINRQNFLLVWFSRSILMLKQDQFQQSSNLKKSRIRLGKVQSLDIIYLETPNSKFENFFDYEQQYPKARKMMLKDTAVLAITNDQKFCFLKDNFEKDQKSKKILQKIKLIYCSFRRLDNYYLLKPILHPLGKQVWLDISSLSSKVFPLRKNDVVKLGGKIITIKQLMMHDQLVPNRFDDKQLISLKQIYGDQKQAQNQSIKLCNLCNSKGVINNPLITPCKCQNSDKYTHFKCLGQYLSQKIKIKANQFRYTVNWYKFKCERCQQKLKITYKIDQNQYKVLLIPRPQPPYIIFEHQSYNKNKQKKAYLQIVPMSQTRSLCIGRSTQSHICLAMDQSLESGHCQLIYDPEVKKFMLTDLNSKYGTLIKVRQSIKIRPHHPNIRIQIQNVAIDLVAKRSETTQKCQNFDESNKLFENQLNPQLQQDSQFFI